MKKNENKKYMIIGMILLVVLISSLILYFTVFTDECKVNSDCNENQVCSSEKCYSTGAIKTNVFYFCDSIAGRSIDVFELQNGEDCKKAFIRLGAGGTIDTLDTTNTIICLASTIQRCDCYIGRCSEKVMEINSANSVINNHINTYGSNIFNERQLSVEY